MSGHSQCLLCQGSRSVLLKRGARHAPEVEVRSCPDCGLVFLSPLPSADELRRYYSDAYRQEYGDPPIEERYRADVDEANIRLRRLLPLLRPQMSLLEIGCGSGAFLEAARPYVAELQGVEPDTGSREWIERRMKLSVEEELVDILSRGKTFDLVALFHVLEHFPDPVDYLRTVGRLLQPGGRLIVEVPNVDDVLVSIYKIPAYLGFYYQKAHLCYFSKDTLSMTFSKAGFKAVIEGVQRYDLSNHMRWMLTGQPGGQGYYSDILSPEADAAYARSLIRNGRSDTLWAVAQLNE